ncbi:TonB-dependent receptor [Tunturiibacter gelidoferens]|uniref:TonB-dependent receptor n=1 Tax=Tunturiibacter gelidiferens TaxID=3069689 RepID=A0AAU7YZL0_9BACT
MKDFCTLRLLLLIFCATTFVIAQSTDATISGLVIDSSGKVIVGAEIEVLNETTGVRYDNETNGAGVYTLSILPPGQYRVQVSKVGFKTLIKPDIVLNVQSAVALNFTLPVGAASESITVEAGASRINTTDASVSTVIDRKFVENTPLNGRSFQDLISLTPGAVTQSPQNGGTVGANGDFSINGQRTESNSYIVDGVSGNTNPGNTGGLGVTGNGTIGASTALGTTQSLISVDALQEFRVESSSYSAEYGQSPGGQFLLLTRSGTNAFHGTAFDYLRNNYFDANDWFGDHYGTPIPALRQNDFGGTIGGHLWIPRVYDGKDKTFFFASYEGLRLTQPQAASIEYVPDVALRQSAAPALQGLLSAFPLPSAGGIDYGNLAQFIEPYSLPGRIDSTSIRVDHTLGPKLVLFFRFSDTPSSVSSRNLSSLSQTSLNTQTYTLGATSQLSERASNQFRLGYSRGNTVLATTLDSFGGATPSNAAAQVGTGMYRNPATLLLLNFAGVGSSLLNAGTSGVGDRDWNLVDTFSWSLGHHQLKVGVNYRRRKELQSSSTPLVEALYYNSAAIQTNQATVMLLEQIVNPTPVLSNTAAFAEDAWHLNSRLNLTAGVRWEIDPAPNDEHGNDAYTLLGSVSNPSSLSVAPRGTPLWQTYWFNFAPRLGAAWIVHNSPGWETVLRFGVGVFFDTLNEAATNGFGALGFSARQESFGGALPVTAAQLNFAPTATPPYTSQGIYAFPAHLQAPYTLQWNTALEQALGKTQSVTVSYVGASGRRLLATQTLSLGALNPDFGTVYTMPGNVTSNYQALQLQFQRNVSHGLQALASYTWSHAIDDGSSYSQIPLSRGDSDFDVRNNFSGALSWDIPGPKHGGTLKGLFGSWGTDARLLVRSAFPINLLGNSLFDPSTGESYYSGVNFIPGRPTFLYGPQYPGGRAINGGPSAPASTAAFVLPSGTDTGNAPRNFVRGFGATQVNLALRRSFPLSGAVHIQFRAEAFNVLNHPNFGYVDPTLTDATFGQATQTLNQSLGTMAAQYQQGGPRSMQFALKLVF